MRRFNFFVVTFVDSFGDSQIGRTFQCIRNARNAAKHIATFASNVRIMKGGPGGIEVQ